MLEVDSAFRKPLELACSGALRYLQSLEDSPVCATLDSASLRAKLERPLHAHGTPPDRVIEDLLEDTDGDCSAARAADSSRGLSAVHCPPRLLPIGSHPHGTKRGAIHFVSCRGDLEEIAGAWLKDLLGLPAAASFALVTGCQMAHATCLAAARHALLAQRGWNVERDGLYGAPPIRIITSEHRHGSVGRAARLLGMGDSNVISLDAQTDGTLGEDTLRSALQESPQRPAIVLLGAGDINTGVFDPFETLIPLAKQYGAWVHVDGAFGLWAGASSLYQRLVQGVEQADSWATDGHKLLNVPYDCGYAFVRDPDTHRAAMFAPAPYIQLYPDGRDAMAWNPEWSRRARGFSTYAALRELGRDGVAGIVERCCKHAHAIVTGIAQLDGAQPAVGAGF